MSEERFDFCLTSQVPADDPDAIPKRIFLLCSDRIYKPMSMDMVMCFVDEEVNQAAVLEPPFEVTMEVVKEYDFEMPSFMSHLVVANQLYDYGSFTWRWQLLPYKVKALTVVDILEVPPLQAWEVAAPPQKKPTPSEDKEVKNTLDAFNAMLKPPRKKKENDEKKPGSKEQRPKSIKDKELGSKEQTPKPIKDKCEKPLGDAKKKAPSTAGTPNYTTV